MDSNGIDALLVALKRKEAAGPDDDALPMDDSPEEEDTSDQDANDKIVDLLQDQYPEIYAKLNRQLEASGDRDSNGDLSDTTDMSDVM